MARIYFSHTLRKNPSTAGRSTLTSVQHFTPIILAFVLFAATLSSCTRPEHELGLGLQPQSELLSIGQDTLEIILRTAVADSIRSDERGLSLLGNSFDPISGFTSAWFTSQLRLTETGFSFGENAVADSAALILRHVTNAAYGNSFPQQLSVEVLVDSLAIDSSYYTTDRFATTQINIAASSPPVVMHPGQDLYLGDDTLSPQVRIPLDISFAQGLVDADTAVYVSNDAWQKHFPGLTVKSSSGGGGIVGLDGISGASVLRIYYHNTLDTTSYDFAINANCARVNQFSHQWSTEFAALNDSIAIDGDQELCLLGAAGSFISMTIPGIAGWDSIPGRVINRAELFLPVSRVNQSKLPRPTKLTAILKDPDGGFSLAPDLFGLASNYGGQYDSDRGGYVLNLPRTIQQRLTGVIEQNEILLYSELSSVALEQVIFSGTEADAPSVLVVTYSD